MKFYFNVLTVISFDVESLSLILLSTVTSSLQLFPRGAQFFSQMSQTVSHRGNPPGILPPTPSSLSLPTCPECCSVTAWPTPLIPVPSEHSGLVPLGPRMGHKRAAHKYHLQQLRRSPFLLSLNVQVQGQ